MAENLLLSEEQGVELLAFLITAARCLLDEPASYGSMRLLDAAERLSLMMNKRSSPQTEKLLAIIVEESPRLQSDMADKELYTAGLDALCRAVAQLLKSADRSGRTPSPEGGVT